MFRDGGLESRMKSREPRKETTAPAEGSSDMQKFFDVHETFSE